MKVSSDSMRIIFNCINNVVGGGVQNSANFIANAVKDADAEYFFMVSPSVNNILQSWGIQHERIVVFEDRKKIISTQIRVCKIEKEFSPDLVYTMAGPSFVFFKSFHVLGTSNPYITHAKLRAFFLDKSFFQGLKKIVLAKGMGLITRVSGNHFVFQTPTSRLGFCKKFFCSESKTALVPNAIGPDFMANMDEYKPWDGIAGWKTVLCPSAYYAHKNIEILFKVARILKHDGDCKIRFVFTIDSGSFDRLAKKYPDVLDMVSNVGPYNYSDALSIYRKADAVVLPSLLETFSTVYIEAMALGLPLFVPREDFAEDICGEYGIYYDSLSESSLLDALREKEDESTARERGRTKSELLGSYGTQEMRYSKIILLLERLKEGRIS